MRKLYFFSTVVLSLSLIDCTANTTGKTQPASPVSDISIEETPSDTPLVLPSLTSSPSPTASLTFTPTYTPTQEPAFLTPIEYNVDCISNPLTVHRLSKTNPARLIGSLEYGEKARVVGKNYDGSWWMIEYPRHGTPASADSRLLPYLSTWETATPTPGYKGKTCWVDNNYIILGGDIEAVPLFDCYEYPIPLPHNAGTYFVCIPRQAEEQPLKPAAK